MAYDNEYRLVSKVIAERAIVPVLERGVRPEWIVDDDLRRVWNFVVNHYSTYREVPTIVAVRDNFPAFKILKVEDTLDYLIDKMVEFRRNYVTRSGLEIVIDRMTQNDHESALSEMSKTLSEVNAQGITGVTHLDLTKDPFSRLAIYESVKDSKLLGVPTGFEIIDEATAGLQSGQLVTLIAPPKTGKSQISLRVAVNTHDAGFVPMYQSFEMNNREQSQRHDAMRAHISAERLRNGKLTEPEVKRLKQLYSEMEDMKPFHMVDAINGMTIDALVAKLEQLKPDIAFVDGVYLMLDQVTGEANTPQALTNITRGLKRVAQKFEIPIVITTQTLLWKMKKGKVSADSIGYSSSFFQDSDVILGLQPTDDDFTRELNIVQSRNSGPAENEITWNWETGCFHDKDAEDKCKYCNPWGR